MLMTQQPMTVNSDMQGALKALARLAMIEDDPEIVGELKVGLRRGTVDREAIQSMLEKRSRTLLRAEAKPAVWVLSCRQRQEGLFRCSDDGN